MDRQELTREAIETLKVYLKRLTALMATPVVTILFVVGMGFGVRAVEIVSCSSFPKEAYGVPMTIAGLAGLIIGITYYAGQYDKL